MALCITLPSWVQGVLAALPTCRTDEDKMRLVITLARENVVHTTGEPFGAAVFQQPGNHLVAVGVNRVEQLHNAILHAEIIALMLAEVRLRSYTLRAPGFPAHELITSCTPCAMCLGAALWSGVRRIVCGAGRTDAAGLGFEEGQSFRSPTVTWRPMASRLSMAYWLTTRERYSSCISSGMGWSTTGNHGAERGDGSRRMW